MRRVLTAALATTAMVCSAHAGFAGAEAVWQRHVQAATSGDIEAVMRDFDESSAIITPEGVLSGTAAIRGFFEEFLAGMDAEAVETVVSNSEFVLDDVVVSNFTIGALDLTFHDTAVIRGDRIAVLSTVKYRQD